MAETPLDVPYRYIHEQWDALQDGTASGDPALSAVIKAMVRMELAVIKPMILANKVPGFQYFYSYGIDDIPDSFEIVPGELVALHYPIQMNDARDATTADLEGWQDEEDYEIAIALLVGHSEWESPALMARSADLPHLWRMAYSANALLKDEDGLQLLENPITLIGNTPFGEIGFAGEPVGWMFTVPITLEYTVRTWYAG